MSKIGINNLLKFNYLKKITPKTVTSVIIGSTMFSAVIPAVVKNNEPSEIKKNNIENLNIEKPFVHPKYGTIYEIQFNPDLLYYTKSQIDTSKRRTNLKSLD